MKTLDHNVALELRFDSDIGENKTIRDYLHAILIGVWTEGEGFSGKRPFGNSGWEYDLYEPLIKAGFVKGKIDPQGCVDSVDKAQANEIVSDLIHFAIYGKPTP